MSHLGHRRLVIVLAFLASLALAVPALADYVPDPSAPRSDVPEGARWDPYHIFENNAAWEQELQAAPDLIRQRLDFMSPDHHAVRNFAVRELPKLGKPFSIQYIAQAVRLPEERTARIVEDLERNRFFLVRRDGREVSWAFPVTVDQTAHHLVFSTGERLDAA